METTLVCTGIAEEKNLHQNPDGPSVCDQELKNE